MTEHSHRKLQQAVAFDSRPDAGDADTWAPSPLAGEGSTVVQHILEGEGAASERIAHLAPSPFIFAETPSSPLPQQKSGSPDFCHPSEFPNSGKPEFGWERGNAASPSKWHHPGSSSTQPRIALSVEPRGEKTFHDPERCPPPTRVDTSVRSCKGSTGAIDGHGVAAP